MLAAKRLITGLTVTLLLVACAGAGTAQTTVRRVNVVLTCPVNMESEMMALHVTVAPWLRTASQGETISWNLVVAGGGTSNGTITVASDNWPFPNPEYSGNGGVDVTVPGDAPDGDFNYDIVLDCNGTRILIDPGMRIG